MQGPVRYTVAKQVAEEIGHVTPPFCNVQYFAVVITPLRCVAVFLLPIKITDGPRIVSCDKVNEVEEILFLLVELPEYRNLELPSLSKSNNNFKISFLLFPNHQSTFRILPNPSESFRICLAPSESFRICLAPYTPHSIATANNP